MKTSALMLLLFAAGILLTPACRHKKNDKKPKVKKEKKEKKKKKEKKNWCKKCNAYHGKHHIKK